MKKIKFKWFIGILMVFLVATLSLAGNPPAQTHQNAWTVFQDTFTDYTSPAPFYPYWIPLNASATRIYLNLTDNGTQYNIATSLAVASDGQLEVLTLHQTRLANYSFQYFTKIPSGGHYSESLFRFYRDPSNGNEYGYSFLIGDDGHIQLRKVLGTSWTILSDFTYDTQTYDPHSWLYVKIDIRGDNMKFYLNLNQILDFTDSSIPSGGIGFRAWNSKAYYYYPWVVMSEPGQWKILYASGNPSGGNYARVIDPDAFGQAGDILIPNANLSQIWPNFNTYLSGATPTPFGDRLVWTVVKSDFQSQAFCISNADGSNFHLLWDFAPSDGFHHELESVGVDQYAYVLNDGEIGKLSMPLYGPGTYTVIEGNLGSYKGGPVISPDGSFYTHIHTRMSGQNPTLIPRNIKEDDYVTVYDEWLMDAAAQEDRQYAQTPLDEDHGVVENYGSGWGLNWCGFELNPQQWDWDMRNVWWEMYGPNGEEPNATSPNSIWVWNMRNGQHTQFTEFYDDLNNQYSGLWQWPVPDPRLDHQDQVLVIYTSTEVWKPGYPTSLFYIKKTPIEGTTYKGEVRKLTGDTGGSSLPNATNGVWWNKPD